VVDSLMNTQRTFYCFLSLWMQLPVRDIWARPRLAARQHVIASFRLC
jgi:hypothetical protein